MNPATTPPTDVVPANAKPVPLSASLAHFVQGDVVIDGHLTRVIGTPSPADIAEARKRLPEAEHLCRDSDPRVIAAWCRKLSGLGNAPKDNEGVQKALGAIIAACSILPACVWTAETSAEALRTFEFFPTPAKVYALLSAHADRYKRTRDGLKRVAEHGGSSPDPEPIDRSQEALDAVAAMRAAFVSERSWNQKQAENIIKASGHKSVPVSKGMLLKIWEKELADGKAGAGGAADRVARLRKELGVTTPRHDDDSGWRDAAE